MPYQILCDTPGGGRSDDGQLEYMKGHAPESTAEVLDEAHGWFFWENMDPLVRRVVVERLKANALPVVFKGPWFSNGRLTSGTAEFTIREV